MPDLISHSVNSCSCPSDLKITDMRFVDIDGAPKRCTILKIETNQGITGYGEVRDLPSRWRKMTPQAQNALLKSLEEPVAQVVFLLMTHELTATLGTIASRCVRVKLSPWPDEQLKAALLQAGYPMDRVEAVLPRSAGNIG